MERFPVVVMGAGPAGLTAAYELNKKGIRSIVLEQADKVGGISRTETYKGYRFDIGGHRFYTKSVEVQAFWQEILAKDFIRVPRMSRIYYDGKFYDYPLSLFQALGNLGPWQSFLILMSYLKAKCRRHFDPHRESETFESWVKHCFGDRLYQMFFKTYTEKVWGIPCNQILAVWAVQRIQDMSLKRAVINALFGSQNAKSLINEFDYPRLGPGMMWERCQELIEQGGSPVHLKTKVIKINHERGRVKSIVVEQNQKTIELTGNHFINSMPISLLVQRMDPLPPDEVLQAAQGLNYRDFLIVALVINKATLFPDNWLYIHSPGFKVGRIQNFKNWSPEMVPDPEKTCLGMEYFCSVGDSLWKMNTDELIHLATQEIVGLNLGVNLEDVEDGVIIRQRKAYPVYDGTYLKHLEVLKQYLDQFDNLQTVGRNGMHRYNNQDHSMLTAMLAVRNILGENHDLWTVNTERSYYESFTNQEWSDRNVDHETPEIYQAVPI
jgi:protoporphyrinogen oxidase